MSVALRLAVLAAAFGYASASLPAVAARSADAVSATGATPAFDRAGFARYAKRGPGRIDGTFVMRAGGADARAKAGATIECYPALPYATWSIAKSSSRVNRALAVSDDASTPLANDARLARYARITRTGVDGGFHFQRLPRGRYVLRATLVTAFPRIVRDPLQLAARAVYDATTPRAGGRVVYDYTRAWFVSDPVYVGLRAPYPPAFHLVARHDHFDPRR